MYKVGTRKEVVKLRKLGYTFTEINHKLKAKISKSTISAWCKGVKLPSFYSSKIEKLNCLNRAKGRLIVIRRTKEKQAAFVNSIRKKNHYLIEIFESSREIQKISLAVMYFCEGGKWKSHRGLMLGSSDPKIVLLYINLLDSIYAVKRPSLRARVCYRADQNIDQLETYWSKITGIPTSNFYKTIPDKRTIGKPTKKKEYKGVCVITCAGTKIQLELEEIFKILSESKHLGPKFTWLNV